MAKEISKTSATKTTGTAKRASKAELKVAVKKPSKAPTKGLPINASPRAIKALADREDAAKKPAKKHVVGATPTTARSKVAAAKKEAGPQKHEIKNLKALRAVLDQYPKATGYTVASLLDHEAIYLTNTRGRVIADVLLAKKPSVKKTLRG